MAVFASRGSRGVEERVMVLRCAETGGSGKGAATVEMPCALVLSSCGGSMSSGPPAAAMVFMPFCVNIVTKKLADDDIV